MTKLVWSIAAACVLGIGALQLVSTQDTAYARVTAADLPEVKRTTQNLYLSSEEAFARLSEDPDILFIDVRDPIEIALMGHPDPLDAIVPVKVHGTTFNDALQEYELVENPVFLDDMASLMDEMGYGKDHQIIVTCGSGWRSALAAQQLADAGYANVWHIPDGYEGEEKPGINTDNAWKLSGLPWTTTKNVWGSAWRRDMSRKQI